MIFNTTASLRTLDGYAKTGEFRVPKLGEFFVSRGTLMPSVLKAGDSNGPDHVREILVKIPEITKNLAQEWEFTGEYRNPVPGETAASVRPLRGGTLRPFTWIRGGTSPRFILRPRAPEGIRRIPTKHPVIKFDTPAPMVVRVPREDEYRVLGKTLPESEAHRLLEQLQDMLQPF